MTETPNSPQDAAPKRRFPIGRVVLVASLALNLLIIGLIAGRLLGGPPDRDRNPLLREMGYGPFVAALEKPDKRALTEALRAEAGPMRENRRAIKMDVEAFLAALRAEAFDVEMAKELILRQRQRLTERQELGQRLLIEQIAKMSAAERAAYADAIEEKLKRRRR